MKQTISRFSTLCVHAKLAEDMILFLLPLSYKMCENQKFHFT